VKQLESQQLEINIAKSLTTLMSLLRACLVFYVVLCFGYLVEMKVALVKAVFGN